MRGLISSETGRNRHADELTEVKRGQAGTGLLIERDGHILGDCDTIRQVREDIESHHRLVCPEHFVVSAVFQKYGIKNANGRIYPENVLKREVERYVNERVAHRNALGSLDHPSCVPDTHQALTESGWKSVRDVEEGEKILTLDPETKEIEANPVTRKIAQPYKGKMVRLKGRSLDMLVTPNHKFPVFGRGKKFKGFYTADDILKGKVPDQAHSYFLKDGEWKEKGEKPFATDPIGSKHLNAAEENYDGMVYCVEVKNHTFYCMGEDGKCAWTGNSSSLSGHDISHNILSLRWEGRTLLGEMELHLSPGYIHSGVCSTSGDLVANMLLSGYLIGVSSRGVGSVKQMPGGVMMVDDDFEIICWDCVLEPSTNNAWIRMTPEELEPYKESDGTKEGKGKVNENEEDDTVNEVERLLGVARG